MGRFDFFKEEMMRRKVCITASYAMTGAEGWQVIRSFLVDQSTTKYVALFLSPEMTKRLFDLLNDDRDLRGEYVFLMTSDITASSVDVFTGKSSLKFSVISLNHQGVVNWV